MKKDTFVPYSKIVGWEQRLKREEDFFCSYLRLYDKHTSVILDVGCGEGHHLRHFSPIYDKAIGLDYSPDNLANGQKEVDRLNLREKIKFVEGDMREVATILKDEKFDLIYCIGNSFALFPLDERISILKQLISLLKNNGRIIVQVVNYNKYRKEKQWFFNPTVRRAEDNLLDFFVRIQEWADDEQSKVLMHFMKSFQKMEKSHEFETLISDAEFYNVKEKNLELLKQKELINIELYGNFQKEVFHEEESRDLIFVIHKKEN